MAELNCGIVAAAVIESPPDSGLQDKLTTPEDNYDQKKNKSDDLEEVAVILQELLRPLPTLSLRSQEALTARSFLSKKNEGMIGREDVRRRGQGQSASDTKTKDGTVKSAQTDSMSAIVKSTSRHDAQAGTIQSLALISRSNDNPSQSVPDVAAPTKAVELHPPIGRKSQDDVVSGPPFQQHVSEKRYGMTSEKVASPEMRRMPDYFVDISNRSGDSAHANGWTYQFKTWGREHAVTISPSRGTSADDTLLSLRPTSHLVEQRLQAHPENRDAAGQWVLHEHSDDQEKHQGNAHRDDPEEDEQ